MVLSVHTVRVAAVRYSVRRFLRVDQRRRKGGVKGTAANGPREFRDSTGLILIESLVTLVFNAVFWELGKKKSVSPALG